MRKPAIITWLLLPLLWACGSGGGDELPKAAVARGEFLVRLAIPGELQAVRSVSVAAPTQLGTIKVTKIIDEGTRVTAGDVLVEFDRTEMETELEDEEAKLEVATTKIKQKQAQLDVQLADLADAVFRAELDLERASLRLTDSETVPRVERENAKLDVKQAEIALERARKGQESAKLQGDAELELLEIEARRARAKVRETEEQLGLTVLRATSSGLVIKEEVWHGGKDGPIQEGDTVWRGSQILQIPDLTEMQVIAWVHEVDAGLVAMDQPATVVIDAHPDPTHAGVVSKLADLAVKREEDSQVKLLKVTIALPEVADVMKPGMTVRAEILVDNIPDVLSVPREAVFYEDDSAWAYVEGLTGWHREPIETGRTNDTHVVVTAGLEEGQQVALVDPTRWQQGQAQPAARSQGVEP